MPLIHGADSTGKAIPLLVDASGQVIVSRAAKVMVDTSGGDKIISVKGSANLRTVNTNLAAGQNDIDIPTVPANEAWVLTNFTVYYAGTVAGVTLQLLISSTTLNDVLAVITGITSGVFYDRQGYWLLFPGEIARLRVTGATLGDDAIIFVAGWTMTFP